ncbi:glutathione synthetase ATP-binding domain-like protein [Basidiobolus meristosporus CBS 931.73]|uniref:Glutathione synthetase ATP-binding domain-like protein n=1 Tax=Basidiobolus meristosporus CBS 931.73 TaxID=1314790 RepID=A0A1Y1YMA2_9FUNG|nr:glutathione synthetase ATP-binding domain-like protein [Basidiobolus meristosporus CBS 931.73]|eukprot:ORX99125.1 glutathione synthetase ATP-binding domain-like protein [Basidiobolus meristosporus CBS 931.73]
MKVCVLISSYDGTDSPFQEYDEYQDPSRYIDNHKFYLRFITKQNAQAELDEACNEGFDIFLSFLWGQEYDSVAGIEALRYIEGKKVPILGTDSKFLSMTKVDFKKAAKRYGILVPKYEVLSESTATTKLQFPVIVKLANACGSLHMTEKSLCVSSDELCVEVERLLGLAKSEVLVEEYVSGDEYSAIVVETGCGVEALTPIKYTFKDSLSDMQKFLHFDLKFSGIEKGEVQYEPCKPSKLVDRIRQVACGSYSSLGVHGCAYARVDTRVDREGNIYVLEVNPTPAFFSQVGNTFGDDHIISEYFEGGHAALFDQMVLNKMKDFDVAREYDLIAHKYDAIVNASNIPKFLRSIALTYNYGGRVLDLGCGTGLVGQILGEFGHRTEMVGVDLSPNMISRANYHKKYVGAMQHIIQTFSDDSFDHIVSIGALHFLNNVVFKHTLLKMFDVATKSITIGIEDIPGVYNQHLIELGYPSIYSYNNQCIIDTIETPLGWKKTYSQREYMWTSPATGDVIYGSIIRYEHTLNK